MFVCVCVSVSNWIETCATAEPTTIGFSSIFITLSVVLFCLLSALLFGHFHFYLYFSSLCIRVRVRNVLLWFHKFDKSKRLCWHSNRHAIVGTADTARDLNRPVPSILHTDTEKYKTGHECYYNAHVKI